MPVSTAEPGTINAAAPATQTTPRARAKFPLPFPRLESLRSRILAFAVAAALLPAGTMLGVFYTQNRRALEKKINEDLLSGSAQSARASGVWLRERLYDLRVFAGSDEVVVTLEHGGRAAPVTPTEGRLRDYLVSLHERFSDFERLMVLDLDGNVVATSASEVSKVSLPPDWQAALRSDNQIVGDAYWDPKAKRAKLIVAVPAQRADGRLLGAFAAELNLAPVQLLLRSFAADSTGRIHLVNIKGAAIASSDGVTENLVKNPMPPATMKKLRERARAPFSYTSFGGRDVIGTLEYVPQVNWAVIAEISSEAAYLQVRRFRDVALAVIAFLLVAVTLSAYRLGRLIARPLDRLTKAASEVAAGDLTVDLPAAPGGGEVGYLTDVFNHMVYRLRDGRAELDRINETLRKKNEELELLSTTDSLTGLSNHRSLMNRLDFEVARFKKDKRGFSVLVGDVDHFKQYNDAFGHPAGDEVLQTIAEIMRDSTRKNDCCARYGGEEFVIVLPDTAIADALDTAEHIRARVAAKKFNGRKMTLSIGVASYPEDADDAEAIIAVADEALYQAKREGRDRTVRARRLKKTG
ncbi:MAG TPA: diguanylate cyclase [Gemmatimonadaceae bacterium]|jgi:diguanylate cyclase (GGDEF)-like protein|nr:diguanylate cyclase [Gemmatimonadaceae bacterium]